MKANIEMTWKEIFKRYFLVRTLIPLGALALFLLIFGNISGKSNSLLVSLGVILGITGLFGLLNFLYISFLNFSRSKLKVKNQMMKSKLKCFQEDLLNNNTFGNNRASPSPDIKILPGQAGI